MSLSKETTTEIISTFNAICKLNINKEKKLKRLETIAKCKCIEFNQDTFEIAGLWGKAKRSIK